MVKVEGETDGMAAFSQLECGPLSTLSPESSFIVIGHGSMTSSEDFNTQIRVEDPSDSNQSKQSRPSEAGESKQVIFSLFKAL